MELHSEGLEMQKQKTPTFRTQRVDQKNGDNGLVITFSNIMLMAAQN